MRRAPATAAVVLGLMLGAMLLQGCAGDAGTTRPSGPVPASYTVRAGDTLFGIATRFGLDHRDIARWNRLGDGSLIYPGQRLQLVPPGSSDALGQPPPAPGSSPAWQWPAEGRVAQRFGESPRTASGILIEAAPGTPVVAAAAGEVVYAGSGLAGYGLLAIVRHDRSWLTAYGHNQALLVGEGDRVERGQALGRMGEGAGRPGALHFEIRRDGAPVDPLAWLPRR